MLLPEDDFPFHQTPEPLAHTMGSHPNAYDRFWFNGYTEDRFFAVALGLYPNRGLIDAAVAVRLGSTQRSVFAGDLLQGRDTAVGPIRVEIIEPLRVNRVVVDAPEQGIVGELTYTARFDAFEEPRLAVRSGTSLIMEYTRASQLGTWSGFLDTPEGRWNVDGAHGTKDRSWGIRTVVGENPPGAPRPRAAQFCFFWAPLHFPEGGLHYLSIDDEWGRPIGRSAYRADRDGVGECSTTSLQVVGEVGTRRPASATLTVDGETVVLEPLLRFHMRGAGYEHPTYRHGVYQGGPYVAGEILDVDTLDPLDFFNLHIQQVVRARRGNDVGIGILESFVVGPQSALGLTGLLDPF